MIDPKALADLEHRFSYHKPTDDKVIDHALVRERGLLFAKTVLESAPDCRERSLAITKIEEAVMWANAAIARNG